MSLSKILGYDLLRSFIVVLLVSLLWGAVCGECGAIAFEEVGSLGGGFVELERPGLDGWYQLIDDGFGHGTNLATRGMVVYKGELYIGTQNVKLPKIYEDRFPRLFSLISSLVDNELVRSIQRTLLFKVLFRYIHQLRAATMNKIVHTVVRSSEGCEIWKYNFSTNDLVQIVGPESIVGMDAGFGHHSNCVAATLYVFKDHLYVGTWNSPIGSLSAPFRVGGELWRFNGDVWEQMVGHEAPMMRGGFGNRKNVGLWSMIEFDGYLYVGTMNWDFSKYGGCEIWRSFDGVNWEQVVERGFRSDMNLVDISSGVSNVYAWSMNVFQDRLYVGTFNANYRWFSVLGMGCQLWRSDDGTLWEKVPLPNGTTGEYDNGFGKGDNYGIRTMVTYQDKLYVGTATNVIEDSGCEIWRYDGELWEPMISDVVPGVNPGDQRSSGFGSSLNKYIWSMIVTSNDELWVGTANGKFVNFIEPETEGCEIWRFDGVSWEQMVGDDSVHSPNGFGTVKNEGARSMIEFPPKTGNVVVGTFKLVSTRLIVPPEGCELWIWVDNNA
jgi:hypothetical protein